MTLTNLTAKAVANFTEDPYTSENFINSSEDLLIREFEEIEDEYPDSWYYGYVGAMVVLFVAFAVVLLFIAALVSSRKVRKNAFDLYVLMIVLPDALIVGELAVTTAIKVALGKDYPEDPLVSDRAQPIHDFVHYFYYAANFYLNAVIVHEIFTMVRSAQAMKRYAPPSIRKVLLQTLVVYTLAGLYSLWWVLDVPWAASHRDEESGRIEGPGSEVFPEAAVTGLHICLMALPVLFVFGVFGYVYCCNLLKPEGRTRQLYLYFMRIIVAYVLFYIPGAVTNYFEENLAGNENLEFYAGLAMDFLFPLQTLVTVGLALTKQDILVAWKEFWACRSCGLPQQGQQQGDATYALDFSTTARRSTKARVSAVANKLRESVLGRRSAITDPSGTTTSTEQVRSSALEGTATTVEVGSAVPATSSAVEGAITSIEDGNTVPVMTSATDKGATASFEVGHAQLTYCW